MTELTHNLSVAARVFLFASIAVLGLAAAGELVELLSAGHGSAARSTGAGAG